jgi:hypothetical protein
MATNASDIFLAAKPAEDNIAFTIAGTDVYFDKKDLVKRLESTDRNPVVLITYRRLFQIKELPRSTRILFILSTTGLLQWGGSEYLKIDLRRDLLDAASINSVNNGAGLLWLVVLAWGLAWKELGDLQPALPAYELKVYTELYEKFKDGCTRTQHESQLSICGLPVFIYYPGLSEALDNAQYAQVLVVILPTVDAKEFDSTQRISPKNYTIFGKDGMLHWCATEYYPCQKVEVWPSLHQFVTADYSTFLVAMEVLEKGTTRLWEFKEGKFVGIPNAGSSPRSGL